MNIYFEDSQKHVIKCYSVEDKDSSIIESAIEGLKGASFSGMNIGYSVVIMPSQTDEPQE